MPIKKGVDYKKTIYNDTFISWDLRKIKMTGIITCTVLLILKVFQSKVALKKFHQLVTQ